MSSEMIERVAKAIDEASQPSGQKDYKILLENAARAAIEAMRMPTEHMVLAAQAIEGDKMVNLEGGSGYWMLEDGRKWQAMIDAALTPHTPSEGK